MTSSILFFAAALFLGVTTGLLRNASLRPPTAPPRIPQRADLGAAAYDRACGESCGDLSHAA